MINGSMIVCLQCGSTSVDVCGWVDSNTARIVCSECDHEAVISGFSLGRLQLDRETYIKGIKDIAIYQRNPEITKKIRAKAQQELELDELIRRE